jgi:hypothetical protein
MLFVDFNTFIGVTQLDTNKAVVGAVRERPPTQMRNSYRDLKEIKFQQAESLFIRVSSIKNWSIELNR